MKTVLITGCSSGYGLETARYFLERDWNVVATMRAPREGVLPDSPRLRVLPLDVTDPESIHRALAAAGPIDVLVNNAGIGLIAAVESTPMATVRDLFETNTFGTMAMVRAVIPQFRERRSGVIVNVSSTVTLRPLRMLAAYSASKAAINAFTESLALELEPFDIRVRLVVPGRSAETRFGANARTRMQNCISEPYSAPAQDLLARMAEPSPVTRPEDVAGSRLESRQRLVVPDANSCRSRRRRMGWNIAAMHRARRVISFRRLMLATMSAIAMTTSIGAADPSAVQTGRGEVEVRDNRLFRDGRPWVPHGFYQIAFEVAPGDLARAFHKFWGTAQHYYTPGEYAEMRAAGGDMVRLQIAQSGADPRSPLFAPAFLEEALGAVRAARDAGLTVIVCVQSETHVPKEVPIPLPDDGTRRVWSEIAPRFANDKGVLYELFNEPHPEPNARNWAAWRAAMERTLATMRARARNVVVIDGLGTGQFLDGAPLLDDPQVAYASHPYAFQKYGQSRAAWDAKFGEFARRAPVIITEWQFGAFYCDEDTANATVRFLQYIRERGIGVAIGIWDWAPATTGSVRYGFPDAKMSSFAGLTCHQPGFGPGRVIERWYTTGELERSDDSSPR